MNIIRDHSLLKKISLIKLNLWKTLDRWLTKTIFGKMYYVECIEFYCKWKWLEKSKFLLFYQDKQSHWTYKLRGYISGGGGHFFYCPLTFGLFFWKVHTTYYSLVLRCPPHFSSAPTLCVLGGACPHLKNPNCTPELIRSCVHHLHSFNFFSSNQA